MKLLDLMSAIRSGHPSPVISVIYLTSGKSLGDYKIDYIYANTLQLRPTEDDGRGLLYIPNPQVCPVTVENNVGGLVVRLYDPQLTSTIYSSKPVYQLTIKE